MNTLRKKNQVKHHIYTGSKPMKYLGINKTKETRKLFNENYKPLERENEEDIRRWEDLPCSWISIFKFVRLAILLNAVYIFNAIAIKFM
jgi:hypothetical protein